MDIGANPETMHFANAYNPAVELNEGDVDFLQSGFAAAGSGSEDEEDEQEIVRETQFDDELSSHDVADLLESKRGRRAPVYDDSNMLVRRFSVCRSCWGHHLTKDETVPRVRGLE